MGLSRGMIKLSYRQAESSSIHSSALCLKTITAAAVSAAIFVMWLRNPHGTEGAALLVCSAAAALMAVYFHTAFMQEMYEIAARYLRTEQECFHVKPNFVQLFGFGIAWLAVKCIVWSVMLLPAAFFLHTGAVSYSLSGEREQFMLMVIAALCLTVCGMIFAAILLARLGCVEYLFFSGECNSIFSALDCSWLITRGESGEMFLINWLPRLCGMRLSALSRLNIAEKLTRQYVHNFTPSELYFELKRDSFGEQRIELIPLR